jgi:hypothetical protein
MNKLAVSVNLDRTYGTAVVVTGNNTKSDGDKVVKWWKFLATGSKKESKQDGFCYEHVVDTFAHDPIPICDKKPNENDTIQCWGAKYSNLMATCTFNNLAIRPKEMVGKLPTDVDFAKMGEHTINLIGKDSCKKGSLDNLAKHVSDSPTPSKLTEHILKSPRLDASKCDKWFDTPVLLHVSNAVHIYFKFLDLYNVHKAAADAGLLDEDYIVVRIGNLQNSRLNYMHADFEKRLFPGSVTLSEMTMGTVCFKQAVLVPNAYASVPFQCKMDTKTRRKCIDCAKEPKEEDHPMLTFRDRVIRTCTTDVSQSLQKSNMTHVTIISRKPYIRWKGDKATSNFHRILENEEVMVATLQMVSTKLNIEVEVVRLEEMDICEQIRKAAQSDVLVGVHGAGLVHLWWLWKENATMIEIEPKSQVGNPSFRKRICLRDSSAISHS